MSQATLMVNLASCSHHCASGQPGKLFTPLCLCHQATHSVLNMSQVTLMVNLASCSHHCASVIKQHTLCLTCHRLHSRSTWQAVHTIVPLSSSNTLWHYYKIWEGNGTVWRMCGLPSITKLTTGSRTWWTQCPSITDLYQCDTVFLINSRYYFKQPTAHTVHILHVWSVNYGLNNSANTLQILLWNNAAFNKLFVMMWLE